MMSQMTTLASAFSIALVGSTFLPQQVEPDNTGLPNLPTDNRSTVEIYTAYFPSPKVDATEDRAPRLQRDLFAQPVFPTVADPESPLQRKLAQARKTNQRQQTRRSVTRNTRTAKSSKSSRTSGVTQRRGGRQTIVELARTRLGRLDRHRFRNLTRRNREELRRRQLRRAQNRPGPRVLRQSNVRERLRLNASQQRRGTS